METKWKQSDKYIIKELYLIIIGFDEQSDCYYKYIPIKIFK